MGKTVKARSRAQSVARSAESVGHLRKEWQRAVVNVKTSRPRVKTSWQCFPHIADALAFRGRRLVLRKVQRILAF